VYDSFTSAKSIFCPPMMKTHLAKQLKTGKCLLNNILHCKVNEKEFFLKKNCIFESVYQNLISN
jgi:hypothetical protein